MSSFIYKDSTVMYIQDRKERLESINRFLRVGGMKNIVKLGDSSNGEVEILAIERPVEELKHVSIATFYVLFKDGSIEKHIHLETKEPPLEYVLMINGQYVLIKKWEMNPGRYAFRFLSGFRFNALFPDKYEDLQDIGVPARLIYRKIGADLIDKMNVGNTSVEDLTVNPIFQNVGIGSIVTERKVINVSLPEKDFFEIKEALQRRQNDAKMVTTKTYLLSGSELLEKLRKNGETCEFDDVSMSTMFSFILKTNPLIIL